MESEPSGNSDGNDSRLPFASESATVLPVVASSFSNLVNDDTLQGFAVMAKVAGEAEPQLSPSVVEPPLQPSVQTISELVESNIEVIVPVMNSINTTMSLDSVYAFKGIHDWQTQSWPKAKNCPPVFPWTGSWFHGTAIFAFWKLVQGFALC